MQTRLFAAPSPHIHGGEKTPRIMGDVVLALIPALAVSIYALGWMRYSNSTQLTIDMAVIISTLQPKA